MAKAEFEKSFARLEEILKAMTEGEVSLDNSLKLYEEADKLISVCNKRLTEAEQKIEKLIKTREGELETDDEGNPLTETL